jgi:ABC-2 type transport system ATP-binding protein
MNVPTVKVEALHREFKTRSSAVIALNGVDLEVDEGEVFGLLGPNGAGKTTLIRILSTLLLPTSGRAYVTGHDVVTQAEKVRRVISMASGAERAGYDFITARGNLWFFSQLYGISSSEAARRISSLGTQLDLDGYLDKKMYTLSTGYRQRVTIARAFVNDPRVVFMDEPTIGLDVMTARRIREFLVAQARESRRTIFLATHNMAEVDMMCDRVAIIDRGRILACDTPAALKRSLGVPVFAMEVSPPPIAVDFLSGVHGISGVTSTLDEERGIAKITLVTENELSIRAVEKEFESRSIKIMSSWRQEPTLEEVFVKLVGEGFREREKDTVS